MYTEIRWHNRALVLRLVLKM